MKEAFEKRHQRERGHAKETAETACRESMQPIKPLKQVDLKYTKVKIKHKTHPSDSKAPYLKIPIRDFYQLLLFILTQMLCAYIIYV